MVWWKGYGPGDDKWLVRQELEEMIVLDEWLRGRGWGGEECNLGDYNNKKQLSHKRPKTLSHIIQGLD